MAQKNRHRPFIGPVLNIGGESPSFDSLSPKWDPIGN